MTDHDLEDLAEDEAAASRDAEAFAALYRAALPTARAIVQDALAREAEAHGLPAPDGDEIREVAHLLASRALYAWVRALSPRLQLTESDDEPWRTFRASGAPWGVREDEVERIAAEATRALLEGRAYLAIRVPTKAEAASGESGLAP